MQPRLNPFDVAPHLMEAMLELERRVRESGLDDALIHLVKTRASQINGCAYCVHMHTNHARAHGESDDRLHLLVAWRESPLYTDRERAALAWTEALTRIDRTHAPDADYDRLDAHFDAAEKVALTLLISTINAWNRIAIAFRSVHPTAA